MSDRIQIVDENDNLIGHKTRQEIDFDKDIYRSSALWLTNSMGEVLLAQRKFTKDKDPGLWGPSVAGTVDEGETYEINIYKEAEEEIGLKGYKFKKLKKELLPKPRKQFCQWYSVIVDKPLEYFVPQEDEVEKLKWVKLEDLVKDVADNPGKYVLSMKEALDFLENAK